MKRTLIAGSIAALLTTAAVAEERQGYGYYVGGQIGHAEMDSDHRHESGNEVLRGTLFGGQFGIQPFSNEHWELRLRVEQAELDVDNISDDETAWWYAMDALYKFNNDFNYVFVGPHYEDFDNGSQPGAHLGLGARYHLTDDWALIGEVQGLFGFDDSTTDFIASVGLQYFFGAQGNPKVAMVDDDQDGVANEMDKCPTTPIGHSVDADGCTQFFEQAIVKQVTILFAHDDATVPTTYYQNVADIAEFMEQHPQLKIVVEGHTSLVGSTAYNQKLSERRAQAVRHLLVERYGIAAERVSALGHGETQPLVTPETSTEDAAANRRIEVEMSANKRVAATASSANSEL
ncbi:OmpA family protein [Neiella marina]|uniref:OmpA family protein n=1 Tax=Neiella holothuriorum TaxID=2870530 RepID=A0ABS7EI90_9GAMM|nr:OmpA family protein [Neiella holothuriorum]MBW8192066.1 OmpA family protein [Neiella holothuriorum]